MNQYIQTDESLYTSLEWLYTQRFRAFSNISNPPPLPYDSYASMLTSEPGVSLEAILNTATKCFQVNSDELKLLLIQRDGNNNNTNNKVEYDELMSLKKVIYILYIYYCIISSSYI